MRDPRIFRHSHLLRPRLPYLVHFFVLRLLELRYFDIRLLSALPGQLILLDDLIDALHGSVFLLSVLAEKEVCLFETADLFERRQFSLRLVEQWSRVLAFSRGSGALVAGLEVVFSSVDVGDLDGFKQAGNGRFFLQRQLGRSRVGLWRKLGLCNHSGVLILRNRTSHDNGTILILLLYNNCQASWTKTA